MSTVGARSVPTPPARRGLYRCMLLCASLALVAVGAAVLLERLAETRQVVLRELRIEEQRLERRAHRLGEPAAGATLAALGESRDALRVRIVEALGASRRTRGVKRLRHAVDERAMPDAESMVTLRLSLEGRLAHGAALLELLATVRTAMAPWPSETRGCLLERLDTADLLVDCVVDVLHWSELRVPHAG